MRLDCDGHEDAASLISARVQPVTNSVPGTYAGYSLKPRAGITVISPKRGSPIRMFRFGDGSEDEIDLTASRLFVEPKS